MPMPAGKGPPRPRLVVRVGVSGHREIEQADRLEAQIAQVLGAIGDAARAILAQDEAGTRRRNAAHEDPVEPAYDGREGVEVRIISGLAEGADRLAVRVVRRMASGPIRYTYAAILPFRADAYEEDFGGSPDGIPTASVTDFRDLEAGAQAVLTLDDRRARECRSYGYVALRDALIQHSDVLVAVWDGDPGQGPGGTEDVMSRALDAGVPVVWIHAACEQEPVLAAAPSPDDRNQLPRRKPPRAPDRTLSDEIREALKPSIAPPRFSDGAAPEPGGRERICSFYAEPASAGLPRRAYRAFYEWYGGPRPHYDVRPGGPPVGLCRRFAALEQRFHAVRKVFRKAPRAPVTARSPEDEWTEIAPTLVSDAKSLTRFRDILAQRYIWADALAVRYADAYRSSFVTILPLGALAVLAGLLALFFAGGAWSTPAKAAALFTEGIILYLAGRFYYERPHSEFWHRRLVEYRAVAELLRHQRYVYALGGAERLERESDEVAGREPDAWIGWYVRAAVRELGFPTLTVSMDHARRVLASFKAVELDHPENGQIAYNRSRHERLHRLDAVLLTRVRQLWIFIAYLALIGSALFLAIWMFEPHDGGAHGQQTLKVCFTIALALLPAVASAILGVRAQGEFESFAKRTETTARGLEEVSAEIQRALQDEWTGRYKAALFVRQANDIMGGDLAGWSAVYRHHPAEPPG